MEVAMKSWLLVLAILAFAAAPAWSDQLILKNGKEMSGKLVRADENNVEFRMTGGITVTFKTADVAQIVFKEPELANPPTISRSQVPADAQTAPVVAPPTPATARGSDARTAPAERSAETRELKVEPLARQSPAETDPNSITIPADTPVVVRTTDAIDTDKNRVGDLFKATLEEPLVVDGRTVVPRGAEVTGSVARAKESGAVSGQSELILELNDIKVDGRTYAVRTTDYTQVGASQGRRAAAGAGGGAALGAIIGAIAGGGKGAAIGAATGAAVGTGVGVVTRGATLKVPAETVLEFRLQHPLVIAP
jgi:hypothetical protein